MSRGVTCGRGGGAADRATRTRALAAFSVAAGASLSVGMVSGALALGRGGQPLTRA